MEDGLVHALLLDGQGGAKPLNWQEIIEWSPQQGQLWMNMDYTSKQVRNWLSEESGLNWVIAETLLSEESRPRFSPHDHGVLMAWRGVNLNPAADPEDMVAIRIWLEKDRLISTRRRDLVAVKELVADLERGKGPVDLNALSVALAEKMIWKISDVVDELEDHLDQMEDEVLQGQPASLRMELSGLRRQTIQLRRYLSPQKEALQRYATDAWLDVQNRLAMRETADKMTRELEDLEALRERAAVAHEELQNRVSEQLNNRMYVLSVITAVFLPLGFLTGLFGINVGGIPGSENPHAFGYFIAILSALVVLQAVVFKWRRWL
ncbi:zinc transporter ZntB [Thiomicrorhabdus heinhorstiae]|uniref:Zinc transporter ZntB n=1 Tax=Thiomicrorhabdus heinhorstiae TaxID=2748010 RepID=A0ABS0BWE0_9GAMM|nr:zinc transporter ZntB [Thiomicrorhabdus heinhorstiae]MBF6058137.1 zinc transporter ZntB [Thiomicrorhabdus heinhorstiae]